MHIILKSSFTLILKSFFLNIVCDIAVHKFGHVSVAYVSTLIHHVRVLMGALRASQGPILTEAWEVCIVSGLPPQRHNVFLTPEARESHLQAQREKARQAAHEKRLALVCGSRPGGSERWQTFDNFC